MSVNPVRILALEGDPPGYRRIPAGTRRQAMDWGLALASQGIEAVIDHAEEEPGWWLVVRGEDSDAAESTLRLYIEENRHWGWQQPWAWTQSLFDWGAAVWSGWLVFVYWLSHEAAPHIQTLGAMRNEALEEGQWWRLFTAIQLHADAAHLAANATCGLLMLGLAMGRFGTGMGLLAALVAGAGGNVAGNLLYPDPYMGLGASGMVMGALGLITGGSLAGGIDAGPGRSKLLWAALGAGVMLFVLFGSAPGTDWVAHLGGFLMGMILGVPLGFLPVKAASYAKYDLAAGMATVLFLVLTWRLAFGWGNPEPGGIF